MKKITKKMRIIQNKIDKKKVYNIYNAIDLLKETAIAKFVESFDIAIILGINPKKSEQNVRGTTILPKGIGKSIKVAVFTQGENVEDAKKSGAEFIGMEDLSEKIKLKKIKFDVVIASPDAMNIVGKLGPILGPRGLMPNPKLGTVTSNIFETVKNVKFGQIFYRNDKNGIIHATIGKINFKNEDLKMNLMALLESVIKSKPTQSKGTYIKKIVLSTTMGEAVQINSTILK